MYTQKMNQINKLQSGNMIRGNDTWQILLCFVSGKGRYAEGADNCLHPPTTPSEWLAKKKEFFDLQERKTGEKERMNMGNR